jgi:PIN domain nuclease of toxin-antitoxin system
VSHSNTVVLDASALIVLISKEIGWEKVAVLLPYAIMSSVNIAEVAKYLIEHKGLSKDLVKILIEKLLAVVVAFDSEQAYISAELILKTKPFGLSLGDRACLSLALNNGYTVYTADKAWNNLVIDQLIIVQLR